MPNAVKRYTQQERCLNMSGGRTEGPQEEYFRRRKQVEWENDPGRNPGAATGKLGGIVPAQNAKE